MKRSGECSIAAVDVCSSQAILGINAKVGLDPTYLYYQLTARKSDLRQLAQHGTQPNLNAQIVKDFEILVAQTSWRLLPSSHPRD
jgi:type I restriction enzyme S subunit